MSDWDPAADAAVLGLVAAAATITGLDVHDSLIVTQSPAKEILVVAGASVDSDNSGDRGFIEHQLAEPGYRDQENRFTVFSEIAVLNGKGDIAAARARCYVILRDWARAIADDQTLAGAVISAWVGSVAWRPQQVESGAIAILLVGVDCMTITDF